MSLRNRQEQEALQLHGVNRAVNPSKLQLGWFRTLQNWVPGKLTSIKKKRGVASLSSSTPVIIPGVCTPGSLSQILCGIPCPLGQYAEVTFDGATDPGGIAIRVTEDATLEVFTGLAAIYIPAQTAIALFRYDAQQVFEEGTLLGAVTHVLSPGDVLRLAAGEVNPEIYTVTVNNNLVMSKNITDEILAIVNPCVAFVAEVNIITDPIVVPGGDEPDVVIVAATDESVNNSGTGATLHDDTELTFPIGANEQWAFEFNIFFTAASTTPDVKWAITVPSGATGLYADVPWNDEVLAFGVESVGSSLDTGTYQYRFSGSVINGATPGAVTFQWAQSTASADNTTRKAGSNLIAFQET